MPDLVLHFDADSQADLDGLAGALQARGAGLADVEAASSDVERSRSSLPDVLLVLTMVTTVLGNAATAIDTATRIVHSIKALAEELGLRQARLEVGMKQVPVGELTAEQIREALGSGA